MLKANAYTRTHVRQPGLGKNVIEVRIECGDGVASIWNERLAETNALQRPYVRSMSRECFKFAAGFTDDETVGTVGANTQQSCTVLKSHITLVLLGAAGHVKAPCRQSATSM